MPCFRFRFRRFSSPFTIIPPKQPPRFIQSHTKGKQDQRSLLPIYRQSKEKGKKKSSQTKNKTQSSEPLLNPSANQPQLLTFRGSPRLFLSESNTYHITGRGISFAAIQSLLPTTSWRNCTPQKLLVKIKKKQHHWVGWCGQVGHQQHRRPALLASSSVRIPLTTIRDLPHRHRQRHRGRGSQWLCSTCRLSAQREDHHP